MGPVTKNGPPQCICLGSRRSDLLQTSSKVRLGGGARVRLGASDRGPGRGVQILWGPGDKASTSIQCTVFLQLPFSTWNKTVVELESKDFAMSQGGGSPESLRSAKYVMMEGNGEKPSGEMIAGE